MARLSRRLRISLGVLAALLIVAVLVAPVVILGSGSPQKRCARTLAYKGRTYVARPAPSAVQAIAVGVGVAAGCGGVPQNVNLRSLTGVAPSVAVGVESDQSSLYVRRGVCTSADEPRLLACLRREPR